jgi:3D (Asp-Asp-Asp) domain-containing protein
MRRRLAALAVISALGFGSSAQAAQSPNDPVGDLLSSIISGALPGTGVFNVKATLYHAGAKGVGVLDSLGCKVVPMRTLAVDKNIIPRRTVVFIKETVGLKMPNGQAHDGYWYASDIGGAIKGQRIDLYTGHNAASMKPMQKFSLATLTAVKVGQFKGCPPG